MFKRNKQKGFISAELGIGILVVSLLTIMGFLAASDLNDEIGRAPNKENAPVVIEAYREMIEIFANALDSGLYTNTYHKYESNNLAPRMIINEIGMSKSVFWREVTSGADYTDFGIIEYDLDAQSRIYPYRGSIRFNLLFSGYDFCKVSRAYLIEHLPSLGQYNKCKDVSSHQTLLTINMHVGGINDILDKPKEDTSLNGTWMGDL